MYIWVGIEFDEQLKTIKEEVEKIERLLKFSNSNLTIPFHVSLKMPFFIEDNIMNEVVIFIESLFKNTKSFWVYPKSIDNEGNIAWIRMNESKTLNDLSTLLNESLLNEFNVCPHMYDGDFKFHTTLFLDNDDNKVNEAFQMIKDVNIPSKMRTESILIGISKDNSLGSFKIIKKLIFKDFE